MAGDLCYAVRNYGGLFFYTALCKPVSQSCAVAKRETFWWASGHSNLVDKRLTQLKLPNFCFRTHTTAPWQCISLLLILISCPVACQNFSFSATAHDYETGLFCVKVNPEWNEAGRQTDTTRSQYSVTRLLIHTHRTLQSGVTRLGLISHVFARHRAIL